MTGHRRMNAAARLAGTLVTLAAGEAVLTAAGRHLPALAPGADGLSRTLEEAEPVLVAVSGLRLLALALGAGLIALTAVGAAARILGATRLVLRLDRCTPPSLRRALDGALGCGLAACIGLSSPPAGADPTPRPSTTLLRLADAAPPSVLPGGTTTLRRLPDAAAEGAGRVPQPPADLPAGPPPGPAPATAAATREVVVRPGDSFWRLAERHQASRLGRPPSQAEVVAYWTQLVDLNRHRLVVAGNPDLLFPGQVLHLPCP